jgi:RHS repeat-associated protein
MYDPCENLAPFLGFDGQNVVRTGNDSTVNSATWTFVHGPGTDDPLMAHFTSVNPGYTAYIVTDGSGRQFGVGDPEGYDCSGGLATSCGQNYANNGGKYSGGISNAQSFGAERHGSSSVYKIGFFRNRFYDQQTGRWTQEDPIGVAAGMNLYSYVGNNPVMFTDPFGLMECPTNPKDCVAGKVTYEKTTRSGTLQTFAGALAKQEGVHIVVHSGDRTTIPQGGSATSEHLTTDRNPAAQGAIDFHAYTPSGAQVPDANIGSVAITSGLAGSSGVRIVLHDVGTNTEGPHVHADTRTDIGNRYETGGNYSPWAGSSPLRHVVTGRPGAMNLFDVRIP